MKIAALFFLLSTAPLAAQDAPLAQPEGAGDEAVEKGFSLMEEGAKLLFKGLMSEMEPALDEMGKALSEVEPALKELQPRLLEFLALVDDLSNYQAPERLDNGDIVIRRKPGAPAAPKLPTPGLPDPEPDLADPNSETDL